MTWQKIKPILISALLGLALSSGVLWVIIRSNAQLLGDALGFATKYQLESVQTENDSLRVKYWKLRTDFRDNVNRVDSTFRENAMLIHDIENGNVVIASTFILQNPSVPKEEKEVLRARLITRGSLNQRELMERVLTIPIPDDKPKITGKK